MLMVFSSRSVADEWWRAISESDNATSFQRINAQFYTHNPNVRNMYEFFYSPYFKDINGAFRGKLFLTLLADRGGRDLSIIPNQEYTDHISGNWYVIHNGKETVTDVSLCTGSTYVPSPTHPCIGVSSTNVCTPPKNTAPSSKSAGGT